MFSIPDIKTYSAKPPIDSMFKCWAIYSIVILSYRQPVRLPIHDIVMLIYWIIYLLVSLPESEPTPV